jgi:hypothetical protein
MLFHLTSFNNITVIRILWSSVLFMEQTKSTQKTCCKCTTVGSGVRTNLPWKPRKTIKYLCWVMTIKIRIFGWTMTIKYGFWPPATKPSRIASLSNPLLKSCLWAWSHWQTLTKKDLLSVPYMSKNQTYNFSSDRHLLQWLIKIQRHTTLAKYINPTFNKHNLNGFFFGFF